MPPGAAFSVGYEDGEGFVMAKKTARPQKVPVTVASFLDANPFKQLEGQNARKRNEKERTALRGLKPDTAPAGMECSGTAH